MKIIPFLFFYSKTYSYLCKVIKKKLTMTQEVQVTLTLEVNVTQSKNDIHNFIMELIRTHTFNSSTYSKLIYNIGLDFKVKEEAEIYDSK